MKTIRDYFGIRELVCKHVYDRFGEGSWQYLDQSLLDTLFAVREALGKPIYVNNWDMGGNFTQRGLRCNCCILVKEKSDLEKVYLSAHVFGKAVDFDVKGMTAEEVRKWIFSHQEILPCKIRLEADVNWVHLDVREGEERVTLFKG